MFTTRDIAIFSIGSLLALAVCLVIGMVLNARRKRNLIRRDTNRAALNAQAKLNQVEGDFVLVTGDSMIAHLVLSPVADLPVIDAALPGLTSAQFSARIGRILCGRKPRITVLSIGANDALQDGASEETRSRFRENLREIAAVVEGTQATFILSLPRIAESSKDYAHHAAAMDRLNREVRAFAHERQWHYVDGAGICDAAARQGEPVSVDGLHLTPDASRDIAQALRQRIVDLMSLA